MLNVALLSPIANSYFSRLVAHLVCQEPGMRLSMAVVRTPWTWKRIRSELRRDGPRLLRKVHRKLILGERGFDPNDPRTVLAIARAHALPPGDLKTLARLHRFPLRVVRDHNDQSALDALAVDRPDVIAFTGGGLLRRPLLELPRLGILNSHLGILPFYRGMDVVEWPVAEMSDGPPQIGMTIHFMDAGVDTGDILFTRPLAIEPGDTFLSIRQRMEGLNPLLMLEALRGLRDGTLQRISQRGTRPRQYYVMHPRMERYARQRLAAWLSGDPRAGAR
jgi:folate-dependent phosphoribosylglycinamide formyltransferase PurN